MGWSNPALPVAAWADSMEAVQWEAQNVTHIVFPTEMCNLDIIMKKL